MDVMSVLKQAWQWLTSSTGLPVLVAIIGILAGTIGGVTSQLVAGYFKTRGDRRQLEAADRIAEAAEKRWQHEQEQIRRQFLLEARRDSYVRLLAGTQAWSIAIFEKAHLPDTGLEKMYQTLKDVNILIQEVSLYSQTVGTAAMDLMQSAPPPTEVTKESYHELMKTWHGKSAKLNRTMRRDLGLEESGSTSHNQPQLNEASLNGKKQPKP